MKFIVSTDVLLKQLQVINGVIGTKTVIPILEYFLFDIEDNQLRIVGTDLEVSMQGAVNIESKENGKVAVPSKIIIDILKSLPSQPVTFTINEDTHAIELSSETGKYKISGELAEDFPKFPVITDAMEVKIPAEVLADAISKTHFAISTDELKPALTGLLTELTPEEIRFVSTDGNRLVKFTYKGLGFNEETSFILPRKSLNVLRTSLAASQAEEVELKFNKINAQFSFGNTTIVCRLIDERFPDYNAAIPSDLPNTMVINRFDLLDSLKRIQIFASKSTHQVVLKLESNELNLSSQDLDYSNEAYEKLICEYEGENMEIAFNARYLIEMLSAIESDEVKFGFSEPKRPATIEPLETNENEEITMLIMPIVIRSFGG